MRIAYVGRWTADAADGVRAKVEGQAAEWRRRGHEVGLFRLPPVTYARHARDGPRAAALPAIAASIAATVLQRRSVMRFAPDVVYVRYGLFLPSLGRLQRRVTTVVELNTNDRVEIAARSGFVRSVLNERSRRSLLGGARGLVCLAEEIAHEVAPVGKPIRVIANGAHFDTVATPPARRSERALAVFLSGPPMPWHGLDKVLLLARALPEYDFALVGAQAATLPHPLPANVQVYPPLPRERYASILAAADVGIGSLAMHRAGLGEASPLKVREYLAHGLPVVLGFEDTDFVGADPWFMLRLPNAEDNVREGIHRIREFVEGVRGRRIAREEIAARIDVRAKEEARLAFMAELAAAHQPSTIRR
jgi:hypothetical protein